MIPLQIVIKKDSYAIARTQDEQELVSDIHRMEDALIIFRELTMSGHHDISVDEETKWLVVPGQLRLH
ncbi:MAG: hypothetical protein HW380_1549 [Magnetococcales bacterium]|nr:hypothetical protein [Magnetococcales bacterium]HIJ85186.1 hypothetical protein [Magnetococcales bacterium]